MDTAIGHRQTWLFNTLVTADWRDRLGRKQVGQLFALCGWMFAGAGRYRSRCRDRHRRTGNAARQDRAGESFNVRSMPEPGGDQARHGPALARGASPNHRDSLEQTPLDGVANPDLVNLLLAHGAERR
jgi:hypothetical protein